MAGMNLTLASNLVGRRAFRSGRQAPFGLAEALMATHTSYRSCGKAGKAPKFAPVRESSGNPNKNIARQKTSRQTPYVGWHFFEGGFDARKAYRDNDNCHGRLVCERGMFGSIGSD
jgi:hypothetical protein